MKRDRPPSEPSASAERAPGAARTRPESVAEAVERFQSGADPEASFQFLYQTFFPAVERFFARKGLPPEDCLDITQDTFYRVYTGLDGYRSEARFETWLYRVATSTYLKRMRAAATAKRAGLEVSYEEAVASGPALGSPAHQLDDVLEDERRRAMRAAIRRLPDKMRNCLTLRLYHQLSYQEIAVVMKLKIDTVKVHLFKGRKKLKQELGVDSLDHLEL